VTCGFVLSRLTPSRRPRAVSHGSAATRRRRQGACAHFARSTDLQFVPVLTSLLAARTASSGCRQSSPSAIGTGLQRGPPRPSPALRSRSLAVRALLRGLRLLRARLRREVPGFGAVLIARLARVTDRGAGLVADLRSVARAGVRWRDSRRPRGMLAAKRWIPVTFSVVCSIVKGRSPHSVPNRSPSGSILRDRGSDAVPIRSPLGSSRAWGAGSAAKGIGFLSPTRAAAVGTRMEPEREPIGDLRRRRRGRPGGATPRPVRRALLAVRFRIGSITRTKARDGPEGWRREEGESGEPSRSAGQEVRRAIAKRELQEDEGSAGFDSEDCFREWEWDVTGEDRRART
jgi:hypothetical protein